MATTNGLLQPRNKMNQHGRGGTDEPGRSRCRRRTDERRLRARAAPGATGQHPHPRLRPLADLEVTRGVNHHRRATGQEDQENQVSSMGRRPRFLEYATWDFDPALAQFFHRPRDDSRGHELAGDPLAGLPPPLEAEDFLQLGRVPLEADDFGDALHAADSVLEAPHVDDQRARPKRSARGSPGRAGPARPSRPSFPAGPARRGGCWRGPW